MKRVLFLMLAVVLLVGLSGLSGCCCNRPAACGGSCLIDGSCGTCADCPETCQSCDDCACDPSCMPEGQCVDDCQTVECCEYGQPCGNGLFGGLLTRLFPFKKANRVPVADYSSGGAFGQGTGGTVVYPYYTTRGPRDFLAKNPRSIGP